MDFLMRPGDVLFFNANQFEHFKRGGEEGRVSSCSFQ
jgi:hypothetical protein